MKPSLVSKFLEYLQQLYPNAKCELNYSNELELLLAVMLSAQTKDSQVNLVTNKLFTKYKSLDDYVNADIEEISSIIKRIGLYRTKAKNIKFCAEMIQRKFQGVVPNTRNKLMQLPGVGRKTANVVLVNAFNIPAIPVDTHIHRISKRLNIVTEQATVIDVEKQLMKLINRHLWGKSHHQLIFFGRYFCTAKKPNCQNCDMRTHCTYYNKH